MTSGQSSVPYIDTFISSFVRFYCLRLASTSISIGIMLGSEPCAHLDMYVSCSLYLVIEVLFMFHLPTVLSSFSFHSVFSHFLLRSLSLPLVCFCFQDMWIKVLKSGMGFSDWLSVLEQRKCTTSNNMPNEMNHSINMAHMAQLFTTTTTQLTLSCNFIQYVAMRLHTCVPMQYHPICCCCFCSHLVQFDSWCYHVEMIVLLT